MFDLQRYPLKFYLIDNLKDSVFFASLKSLYFSTIPIYKKSAAHFYRKPNIENKNSKIVNISFVLDEKNFKRYRF